MLRLKSILSEIIKRTNKVSVFASYIFKDDECRKVTVKDKLLPKIKKTFKILLSFKIRKNSLDNILIFILQNVEFMLFYL